MIADVGLCPHSPSRLIFKGRPRKTMVRQLKASKSIPADLSFGPLQEQPDPLDLLTQNAKTADDNYAELARRTADTLHSLMGHDSDAQQDNQQQPSM